MGGEDKPTFRQKMAVNWAGFKVFMYNKENGTVMGRGGKAWGQLLLFYTIFYLCLAAFWASMLTVFLQTIDESQPTWTSYVSTPALAFAPGLKDGKIEYKLPFNKDNSVGKELVGPLNKIYKRLDGSKQTGSEYEDCDDEPLNISLPQRFCRYNTSMLGPDCIPPNFGYDVSRPCIFVNLNKVWGWIPENYADEDNDVPDDVEITENHIAIDCQPQDGYEEFLNYTVLSPSQGISFGHYPYRASTNITEQRLYISPIVAIQFIFTESAPNQKIRIKCMPYASNLVPLPGIYNSDEPTEFVVEFTISSD